jgi:polar amino acid transport system substrate-binding protein
MKRPQRRLPFLIALIFLGAPAPRSIGAPACELSVQVLEGLAPYFLVAADGSHTGFTPDLLNAAARHMGCALHFTSLPFARAMYQLKTGALAVVPALVKTSERGQYAYFSDPIQEVEQVLVVRRSEIGRWNFRSLEAIRGTTFRLGVELGAVYGEEYERLLQDPSIRPQIVAQSRRETLWKMLAANRVDGVIAPRGDRVIEPDSGGFVAEFSVCEGVALHSPVYVAFSKQSVTPEVVARFNAALATLRRDGTYAELTRRYFGR